MICWLQCSLALKVYNKEASCSCLWRASTKLISREGNSNHPTPQWRDSGDWDSESWSESRETWLPIPIRSKWAGYCHSWYPAFLFVKWEKRTRYFPGLFRLLMNVKWVDVFPKCLFHYLVLTGCLLGVWEKSGAGEKYVRKEQSNENADACGSWWVGLGSGRWIGKMRERKTKRKRSDISCKANKERLGK